MEDVVSFGRWLMERRQTLDLTRDELADKVGCAPITIAKIERDERRPSRQMAELLADALLPPNEDRERFVLWARGVPTNRAILEFPVGAVAERAIPAIPVTSLGIDPAPVRFNNLPFSLTSFVGREADLAKVRAILGRDDVRLLTLTGPPGIGKTRLAIAIAASASEEFEHGICWVPLAPITDPELVAYTIAQALGITEAAHTDPLKAIQGYLHSRRMLLLLDNFEQIMPASTVVSALLSTCPTLKISVTSRERLHIYGEHEYPLAPLEVPDLDKPTIVGHITISDVPSIALFVQRAQAVSPSFSLTPENEQAVVEICRKLDGLPLAIELAAARVRFLSPAALLARLDNRLGILIGGARDLPPRQQTLRGAIGWSYELLTPNEKTLFSLLGVFVGGCTLEAIEAVAGTTHGDPDLLEGLASLMDKSLISQDDGLTADGTIHHNKHEPRFTVLEMIREYALEQLNSSGKGEQAHRHHLGYFIEFAERADLHYSKQDQVEWFERTEIDKDNLRAALRWAFDGGDPVGGLQLANALWSFWYLRLYVHEGMQWLEEGLAKAVDAPVEMRADTQFACAAMMIAQDEYALAKPYLEQALRVYTQLGDKGKIGRTINGLALAHLQLGETTQAQHLFEQSIATLTAEDDKNRLALAHSNLSYSLLQQRRYQEAIPPSEKALALRNELGDIGGVGSSQLILGGIALHEKRYDDALELLQKSASANLQVGDRRDGATALVAMGLCKIDLGKYDEARKLYEESLVLYRGLGNPFGIARVMVGFAGIASALGNHQQAVRLCGAILSYYEMVLTRILPAELDLYNKVLADARAHLGDAVVNALMYEGGHLGLDRVSI